MLEFAELCQASGAGLRRFTYLSTAYVAGEHSGTFSEDDLDVGQRFRNPYERSKFEAEGIVKRWRSRMPVTVVRPSIVVGEQDSGWTPSFNVIYWPLRAFSRGAYRVHPGPRLGARGRGPGRLRGRRHLRPQPGAPRRRRDPPPDRRALRQQRRRAGGAGRTLLRPPGAAAARARALPAGGAPRDGPRRPRRAPAPGVAAQRDLLPLLRRPRALRRPPHAGPAARQRDRAGAPVRVLRHG